MVSIVDKLERLYRKYGFRVVRGSKALELSKGGGLFSRADANLILKIADNYNANARLSGRFIISKRGAAQGRNSLVNRRRRLNASKSMET